ncbi:TRAP transporter large permease [Denitromonas ohlonensis]|jgi:tripartite ATP-independent transporter DctM subunit|uniref:TRAP transporter large permease protein n=2 Tax=Denitromonas TaxID=139331 RepID=A0A558E744_9RHOO|nr:TRAP transporter large permease subunit [Denitromonas ohlonensis]TVO59981.1 TRAP transporter large permease subunit [Denitromonas ohlonensis]TVO75053.1 TRAP transporter large permease subunit [Denitromonas ohlonensis]TVT69192.1 MAG: TRAP transporter large permease subunit [Denitromonas halophila]
MTEFLIANMAPLMFGSLIIFLLSGFPVAFALAANGLFFGFVGIELGMLTPALLQALPERVLGIMSNDTLLAIPFFTFMGIILERSGMAEDLLESAGQLFGPIRGGIAYAVIFVGALLAATTGVVAASVISMGLISLPVMLRYGYSREVSAGVICASGTLAQIIPPSLVLIVLADVLGVSVGDAYAGAIIPSLMLVGLLVLYIFVMTIVKPDAVPALPKEARTLQGKALLMRVLVAMVPPVVLIFLVLGTIFIGLATPTEGGAMGAVGALALAWIRKRLNYEMVRSALDTTGNLATFVMFILIGSTVFALTFRAVNGDLWVEHLFSLVPGGQWGFLVVVSALVFVLGFFIDFFEIAFILLPLFAPVAEKLGIDMVWFLVLIGMNMQTSFLTPPFGFALFYLRSVAPSTSYEDTQTGKTIAGIKTMQIYRGVIAFIAIQVFALIMILVFPGIVTGGLDEHVEVDLDAVEINIQQNSYGGGSAYDTPAFPSLQDSDGGGAAPAAEPDPNAALMDALRDAPAPETK